MLSRKLTLEGSHPLLGHDVSSVYGMTSGGQLHGPLFLVSQDFWPPKRWRLHLDAGG